MNGPKIPKNSIKRISLLASIPALSDEVYDIIRSHMMSVCQEICTKSQILTMGRNANTITLKDIEGAVNSIYYLKDMKIKSSHKRKQRNIKSCPNVLTKKYSSNNRTKILEKRVISSQKSSHNCFYIPKSVIKQMMEQHIQSTIRKSKDTLIMLQEVIETHIVDIFNRAYDIEKNKTMCGDSVKKAIEMLHSTFSKVEDNTHTEFGVYIKKVLKQLVPLHRLSSECLFQINTIMNLLANKISSEAVKITKSRGKSTVSEKEIMSSVELYIPGDMKRISLTEIKKSIVKANKSTLPSEAGLLFPPTRAGKHLQPYKVRVSINARIALASLIEYVSAELLESMVDSSVSDGISRTSTLNIKHLSKVVSQDKELCIIIKNNLGYKVPLAGTMVNFKNKW